jgi:hypothetical protein
MKRNSPKQNSKQRWQGSIYVSWPTVHNLEQEFPAVAARGLMAQNARLNHCVLQKADEGMIHPLQCHELKKDLEQCNLS